MFGEQLEKTEKSNIQLSNEVQRITAELQELRMRYSDKEKSPVLYLGDERAFYTDEIKEIVLDIMSQYQKNVEETHDDGILFQIYWKATNLNVFLKKERNSKKML